MSREVLRDAVIYLPARVIPALVGVVAIPVLTRLLSPEQYGQYLLAMTTLMLIASFCFSWLVSVTIRFYIVYGVEPLFRICRPLLIVALCLSLVLWAVCVKLLGGVYSSTFFLSIGMFWLVVYGNFEYFAGWLRARNLAKAYSLALSWRSVAGLLISVALLLFGLQGGEIVILGAACVTLAALLFLPQHALKVDYSQPKKIEYGTALKTVLSYGVPAALINLFTVGLSLADRYIIGSQMGAEPVAIYGASYDIAEKTIFFVNSMLLLSSSVIGFRIFEQEGEAKAADFLTRLMRLYLLAAPPLVLVLALLAPQIIALLLPAKYGEGESVLAIVAAAGLCVGVLHRYSLLLSFHKRTDLIMWCSACALFVNIISCFLLLPKYGIVGAAYSTLIAYASWLLVIRLAASKYSSPQFPWPTFFRVCGALLIAATAIYCITCQEFASELLTIALGFIFSFIAYGFTLLLLKEVTLKEVKSIASMISTRFNTTR